MSQARAPRAFIAKDKDDDAAAIISRRRIGGSDTPLIHRRLIASCAQPGDYARAATAPRRAGSRALHGPAHRRVRRLISALEALTAGQSASSPIAKPLTSPGRHEASRAEALGASRSAHACHRAQCSAATTSTSPLRGCAAAFMRATLTGFVGS